MDIQDVQIIIDVQHPAAKVGLGRPLILATGTGATYKEYKTLEALEADYAKATSVYKKAAAVLNQKNKPDQVSVATYSNAEVPEAGTSIVEVFEKYYDKPWHFLLLPDVDTTDRLAISTALQVHDFKFLVLKVSDKTELAQYKINARTLVYYHPGKADEEIDGAIIGDAASLTVGSITWKFRKNLVGITPVDISSTELDEIHTLGANVYVEKAGIPQTSEGLTATGEYIDFYHGQDWVKSNVESSLQSMLTDNDKVPSNDIGISMIASVLTTTLETAGINGIVEIGGDGKYQYTVTTIPWDQVDEADRLKRIYSGVSFEYKPQGAIHKIKVKGTIVSNN